MENNLKKRLTTGLIAGSVVLSVFIFDWSIAFAIGLIMLPIIICWEMFTVIIDSKVSAKFVTFLLLFLIPAYCFIAAYSLMLLYEVNRWLAFSVMFSVIMVDSVAYFGGKFFSGEGARQLFPKTSEKKTYNGLIWGTLASCLLTGTIAHYLGFNYGLPAVLVGAFIGPISQWGDWLESKLKRFYKVKDSGGLLPGHGGFADRTDALLLTSIVIMLLYYYSNDLTIIKVPELLSNLF